MQHVDMEGVQAKTRPDRLSVPLGTVQEDEFQPYKQMIHSQTTTCPTETLKNYLRFLYTNGSPHSDHKRKLVWFGCFTLGFGFYDTSTIIS